MSADKLAEALRRLMIGCEYKTLQGITAWHTKTYPTSSALDFARLTLAEHAAEKAKPDADKLQYRLLNALDTIEPTDQFLKEDCITWAVDTGGVFVGARYQPGSALRVARREVKP